MDQLKLPTVTMVTVEAERDCDDTYGTFRGVMLTISWEEQFDVSAYRRIVAHEDQSLLMTRSGAAASMGLIHLRRPIEERLRNHILGQSCVQSALDDYYSRKPTAIWTGRESFCSEAVPQFGIGKFHIVEVSHSGAWLRAGSYT